MADILSTSVSGLLAFQQALDVTSNNVANVSTPGYDVETANFAEEPGQGTASGYIGSGVDVASVTRAYNAFLAQQVNASQASYSSFNTLGTWAAQIDNMLSASSTGLTATLQSFTNSLQTLSTSPSSSASGQAVLSSAQALVQQLQSYSSQVSQAQSQVESQISSNVTEINTLASQIASVNGQIARAAGADPGQTPNQLLDQLDGLINQMSQYVTVNTVGESDGEQDVYIGSGQALVLGSAAQQLSAVPNAYNASTYDIGLTSGNSTVDVTSEVTGGSLGGLLSTVSQVLQPTQNALGQLSVGFATLMNQQQAAGMDASGAQGQPMFAVGGVQVLGDSNNTGSASLAATITSLSDLTTDDYVLKYTGTGTNGGWALMDQTTGQPVSMTGTGTSASPLEAAGLSLVVSGTPASDDSFLIQPTAAATQGLSLLLTSPTQIASASLVQATAGTANTGSGSISSASVTDPGTWTANAGTYTISFTSPTQYQVENSAGTVVVPNGTYASGTPIAFEGAQVTLTGAPALGDSFALGSNSPANTGDNSNLLAMISALSASALNGGTSSLSSAANGLVTQVGALTQQAQSNASAQQSVNQSATDSLNNATGVNLDEEAALMVQYQQAYQACAQMIAASTTMFDSLMTAMTYG
ncbi:MAG TPA: flagellar hook-associated protein FlgK [Steroidobacteraceae bacterium]|nr:flagellar hook-associated protein FlgK [Steroidobacteraceae bacterium]